MNYSNLPEGCTHIGLADNYNKSDPREKRLIFYKYENNKWSYITNYNQETNNIWQECLNKPTIMLMKLFAF